MDERGGQAVLRVFEALAREPELSVAKPESRPLHDGAKPGPNPGLGAKKQGLMTMKQALKTLSARVIDRWPALGKAQIRSRRGLAEECGLGCRASTKRQRRLIGPELTAAAVERQQSEQQAALRGHFTSLSLGRPLTVRASIAAGFFGDVRPA